MAMPRERGHHVPRDGRADRQGLAEELLATGRLTVEQVADRVGYAEASSFVHAFRRWNGIAPRRWAREQAPAGSTDVALR
jgi:AraC-like DNA-binding protein